MTFDELIHAILAIAPDAIFNEHPADGEIQVSLGLVATGDGDSPVISLSEA